MANKGRSELGFFGTIHHYDENGKKIGRSEPGLFGGYTNYDAKGNKIGHSDPGLLGEYNHYDKGGYKKSHSDSDLFGNYHHIDPSGKRIGSSAPDMFGSYNHNDSQGCYVATCVYGAYDCPQVWTLRRFRDNTLAKTIMGRAFIRTYYALSPVIVKWFGKTKWFGKFWHGVLDCIVQRLNDSGVENVPYSDRKWK